MTSAASRTEPALVDVLLATYNGSRYLAQQLDSILAQTHTPWRILVSDDGSSDETLAILQQYGARLGDRLVLVPNPDAGKGVVRNFENLMQASLNDGRARWAVFADQDDVWLPEKIASQLDEMVRIEAGDAHAVPCLVHSDLTVVDEALTVLSPSFARYQRMDPAGCSQLSLLSVNQVTGCTMMVNRALLARALPLPAETIMHDWWCALISGSGRRSFIDQPLILYRQHGANQLGAKDRGLKTRLMRMLTDGRGVVQRVRVLGRATRLQAEALRQRLRQQGGDGGYVSEYLSWRSRPLWARLARYRHYYFGPELDRLSRCLLWF
ncbi:MAG: glycosyltransferase family 2 protein [Acidovorax sp.]|nr:MAG: glycosyltransferase family 2 protein [Acidovorax sp.]